MRIKFIFDDGRTVEIGEDDWIGAIAYHDLPSNFVWAESCNSKKALIKALSTGKMLYSRRGVREFSIDPRVVVEAKVIEDGKETVLWRKAEAWRGLAEFLSEGVENENESACKNN